VKTCPDCNGDGVIEKGTDDEQQCPTCGGSGFVPDDDDGDDDDEEVTRTASGMPTCLRSMRARTTVRLF
jgi:RecJ-like exonuclease